MIYAILVPWLAVLHRFRGLPPVFPTRTIYWCWALIPPLLMGLGFCWPVALAWGLGYFVWSAPGYMRWASLGRTTEAYGEGRPLTWDEKIIESCHPTPTQGLIFRGLLWAIPLMVALGLLRENAWPVYVVPIVFPLAYQFAWWLQKDGDVARIAEPIIGAAWGVAIALSGVH
jgi:hypothetical protein